MASVLLLALSSIAAQALLTVQFRSTSENKTTERFSSSVIKEFKGDPRFSLVDNGRPARVIVTLPSRVGYERSLDWTRISYQVRIDIQGGSSRTIHGSCWNWNLRICGQQIANEVANPPQ